MATINKPNTFSAGGTIVASEHNENDDTIYNDYNGNIKNVNLASDAGIVDTKLAQITTAGKVSGAALTSLSSVPSGAGQLPAVNVAAISQTNWRDGLLVTRTGTTTMSVGLGDVEVNSSTISKTSATTLTLTTNGDWASGSSEQATSTYGYVGVDASGNLKLDTTAPTHSNYAVDNTNGFKRYVTWHSTVYRVIGWFYMNATGSGELDTYAVSNLKDGTVPNTIVNSSVSDITLNDTSYSTDMDATTIRFYSIGRPVQIEYTQACDENSTDGGKTTFIVNVDSTTKEASESVGFFNASGGTKYSSPTVGWMENLSEGTHTIKIQGKVSANSVLIESWNIRVIEH